MRSYTNRLGHCCEQGSTLGDRNVSIDNSKVLGEITLQKLL